MVYASAVTRFSRSRCRSPRPHRYALTREAFKAGGGLDLAWAGGDLRLVDAARGETLFRIPEGRLMTPSFAADARATVMQEPDGVRIVYSHPSLVSGEARLKKVATGPWGQAPVRVTEIEECG